MNDPSRFMETNVWRVKPEREEPEEYIFNKTAAQIEAHFQKVEDVARWKINAQKQYELW